MTSTTQLILVSSAESLLAAAAAIDAGLLDGPHRRLLVAVGRAPVPETAVLPHQRPGIHTVMNRFDDVVVLDHLVRPADPNHWAPRGEDRPVFERLLRHTWGIGVAPVELVTDLPYGQQPAEWLSSVFYGSRLIRLSTGLDAYGPPAQEPRATLVQRTDRQIHLRRIPGLDPWKVDAEHPTDGPVPTVTIPPASWAAVTHAAGTGITRPSGRTALVLAEAFTAHGLLSRDQATGVWREALAAAVGQDPDRIVVLADPVAPANLRFRIGADVPAGLPVTFIDNPEPAEVFLAALRPDVVVGTMSPVLLAARETGARVLRVGVDQVRAGFPAYRDPARIPWVIAEALLSDGDRWADPDRLARLLDAAAFTMYPGRFAHRHARVHEFVGGLTQAEVKRYITVHKARALGLGAA